MDTATSELMGVTISRNASHGFGSKPRTRPLVTAERLQERLDYDPETGAFTWKESGKGWRGKFGRGFSGLKMITETIAPSQISETRLMSSRDNEIGEPRKASRLNRENIERQLLNTCVVSGFRTLSESLSKNTMRCTQFKAVSALYAETQKPQSAMEKLAGLPSITAMIVSRSEDSFAGVATP